MTSTLDLVAQVIQQGRDHGLPGYTEWRKFCGLPQVRTFEDLRDVMSTGSVSTLRNTYKKVEDIDLFTGGLAEVPTKGAVVGPTFACLLGRQMYYYKTGEIFSSKTEKNESDIYRPRKNALCIQLALNMPIFNKNLYVDFWGKLLNFSL